METNPNKEEKHNNDKYSAGALLRAKSIKPLPSSFAQAKNMAGVMGIVLKETDPRVALYAVLREDNNHDNKDNNKHYTQKSDQRLFAEALRMLGDEESFQKFITAHPNIFP